jgi:peptide/nickel transport system permease protein
VTAEFENGLARTAGERRRTRPSRAAGFALLGLVAAFAVVAPWISGFDPRVQDLYHTLQGPSATHLLGTDHLGRDVLSRVGHAARLTAGLALVNVVTSAALGTGLGLLAAVRGGWIERSLVALSDALLAIPGLLLVLLLVAFAPGRLWPIYLALSLTLWIEYFRVVRAKARVIAAGPQVQASHLLGFGPLYLVRRHYWPDLAPVIGTLMTFGAAASVLALAAAGFVGAGLQPPTAELGLMMSEYFAYYREAPWLLAAPVVVLVVGVLGLALAAGKGEIR